MCGIAGFFSFRGSSLDKSERLNILKAMGNVLEHRGPDDSGLYDDGHLSLVFRRLSIVDVAHGQQPIFNETGNTFIAINGEIYNHEELRGELRNKYKFTTHSDSEVPLHLIEEEGTAGLKRLNGMYALAIWDRNKKKLTLARDPLGIKPLYICQLPDGLLFGSELKALLMHPKCPREMDWAVLHRVSSTSAFSSASYIKGIELLPGGSYMEATASQGFHYGKFWSIDEHLGTAKFGNNAQAYSDRYRDLLEETTIRHLIGEVPIGLHLSGGTDSSLLAAIAARHGHQLPCFTVVERSTYQAGDVESAKKVTESLGLPWYPALYDSQTLLDDIQFDLERFEQSVWMMDSPPFDLEWILKEELHRFARTQIPGLKVVLLGQGADEFAGGYSKRLGGTHQNWNEYIGGEVLENLRLQQAIEKGIPAEASSLHRLEGNFKGTCGPYHEQMRQFTQQLNNHNLWHEDRSSSSQSMEARVPFLDHRLVELLASIPAELHEKLFWDKKIVRNALDHFLPSFDRNRPKVGFFVTDDSRSIDLLVHRMACRIAPQFREKYLKNPGFSMERSGMEKLIDRVLLSKQTVTLESWKLMAHMAICIFEHQIRATGPVDFRAIRRKASALPLILPEQWSALDAAFSGDPSIEAPPVSRVSPQATPAKQIEVPKKADKKAPPSDISLQEKKNGGFLSKFKSLPSFGTLFECREIDGFAHELVTDILKNIPPDRLNSIGPKAEAKLLKTTNAVLSKAKIYNAHSPLSFYKKAQLSNKIRWKMRDAGYPEQFSDELSHRVILAVTPLAQR